MERIFIWDDLAFDLGNIKHIDTRDFNGCDDGCYVQIHLLKGSEYVFNPQSETTELLRPIIEKGFGENRHAISFIETVSEAWGKYLETREANDSENETENPFDCFKDE